MCHPPRLGIALLTTYVALATALIDGSSTLNLEYLPINLSDQRPPQSRTHDLIHPGIEDLMESNNDHPNSGNSPSQRTEDLEELALAFLADKLRAAVVEDGLLTDHQRRATLQEKDLEELLDGMNQDGDADTKSRLTRQAFDLRIPRDQQFPEHYLVNCRSGSLDWPPCALFNGPDTGPMLHDTAHDLPDEDDVTDDGGDDEETDQPPADTDRGTTRSKRDAEVVRGDEVSRSTRQDVSQSRGDEVSRSTRQDVSQSRGDEVSRSTRQEVSQSRGDEVSRSTRQVSQSRDVLPSNGRKGFSAWSGKRVPPFGSWGGKRAPDFHSWGGKRAEGGLKSQKTQLSNPTAWEGKRVPAFHSWGGKRAPSFNSWGGKRAPSFNSWGGKRAPSFNSWGGKRAPLFNSWGGKRAPLFNSWGGKREPAFNSWGGKRAPTFNSWGGKRAPFNSWGGKRAPFNSWGGKRAPFNSWGGKRAVEDLDENSGDRLGQPLVISTYDSQLSKVNDVGNGGPHFISDGQWDSLWVKKWPWASAYSDKQKAAEIGTPNKPPEK